MISLNEFFLFYLTFPIVFIVEILICGWKSSSLYLLLFPKKGNRKSVFWDWISLIVEVLGAGTLMLGILVIWEKPIYDYILKNFGFELKPGPQTFFIGLIFYIAYDFLTYWFHRAEHKFSWLWNGHQFHHSATIVNAVTNDRDHPIRRVLHIKKVIFLFVGIYVFNVYVMQIRYLMNRLSHSRIDSNYGWFGRYIVSPRFHHLHHDKSGMTYNYAEMFVVWDRLFGTYREPEKSIYDMEYGISDNFFETKNPIAAYLKPFIDFYLIPTKKVVLVFRQTKNQIKKA